MCNSNNANICKHKFAKLPKKTYNQTAKHKSTTNALIHKDKNKIYKSVRDFKTKKYKWIAGLNNNIINSKATAKNEYYIHDNGSRPFKVHIKNKNIYIYKGDYAFGKYYYEPYLKVPRHSAFIGANPPASVLVKPGIGLKNYPGNTILLEYENGNYLFIERDLYVFKPDNKIKYFYSYVGNNDVPYAYAIDDKYTYLFAYRIKIANTLLKADEDPYNQNIKKGDSVNITLTPIESNISSGSPLSLL
jgi:hypothetical protein